MSRTSSSPFPSVKAVVIFDKCHGAELLLVAVFLKVSCIATIQNLTKLFSCTTAGGASATTCTNATPARTASTSTLFSRARDVDPVQPSQQGLRLLQTTRRAIKMRRLPTEKLLQPKVPKEGLEAGAPRAVREAAASVCAAATWMAGCCSSGGRWWRWRSSRW